MTTNKNGIISQLPDSSSSSDEQFYMGPEHLSLSSRKSWTSQHERKREVEREKRNAALASIFEDPSFPLFSIGSTNDSCAGVACVEHSSRVFRNEAPVNVRVFLYEFLDTIP